MALVLDTGPVVAALDAGDRWHARCKPLLLETEESLIVPAPTLVEIDYWLRKRGSPGVWDAFVEDLAAGAYELVHLSAGDLLRAAELQRTYLDLDLGVVDASVIAVCERLEETKVATLDRRHFGTVRPVHCTRLRLLPEAP